MLIFTPFHATEGFPDAKERATTKSFLQKLHIFLPVWKQYIIQEILSRLIGWQWCLHFRPFHMIWPQWAVSSSKIYLLVVLIRSRAFFFKSWQIFLCKLPLCGGIARYYYHTRKNLEPLTPRKETCIGERFILFNTIEREIIELVGAQSALLLHEAEALKHSKRGMIWRQNLEQSKIAK